MENNIEFKCISDETENIPEEIMKKIGLDYQKVHYDGNKMAILAKEIKEYNKDTICKIPFSNTIEAESLGGIVKVGDGKKPTRIGEYTIKKMENINYLKNMDFKQKSINEVLKTIKILNDAGEKVSLSVTGPFTIATSLMDVNIFYRTIRNNRDSIEYLFSIIEKGLIEYIFKGIENGASIISYADPSGTIDIVGPKMYKEYSGKITHRILKAVESKMDNAVVHICGKTSESLKTAGYIHYEPIKIQNAKNYGEAVINASEDKNIKFIGKWCIKRSPYKKADNTLWSIKLE